MSNNQKHNKIDYRIDISIVFAIMACLIFLVYFANAKFNEIAASDREALLIEHDQSNPIHNQLADSILEFRPDACKMIEVYSETYEPIFRVQFKEDDMHMQRPLSDYPDLMKLFDENEDGHTEVIIDDTDEDIYFRWTMTTTGERCLFIIYMSRPIIKNLWVFTVVCCLVMVLVGILFLRLYMRMHANNILRFEEASKSVQDAILN